MGYFFPPRFPHIAKDAPKAFLFIAIFSTAACATRPPETLALQCITGSAAITGAADWSPLVVDSASSSIGGHPATITDDAIRWEIISRNGFGGATHTQYDIDRSSGTVTADSTYVNPRGNRAAETGRYAGECYPRHRAS
jgi:hypothetical protein